MSQPPTDEGSAAGGTVGPGASEEPGEHGGNRRGVAATSLIGLLLGGAATFYVVRRLVADWPAARASLESANLAYIALAVVLAALAVVNMGLGWRSVLRLLGVHVPVGRTVAWYFVGELGKYLPGGVWPVVGRGELARRGGVPRTRAYTSVALSLGLLYLAALFVAAGFLPFALAGSGGGFNPWMLFLLALPLGVVLLHHAVLERLVALVSTVTRREIDVEVPRWADSLRLVANYVPTWFLVGTATWAVARSLTPDASYPRVMFAAVLSWTAGFLAIPVPAGAGIREAVLAASSGLDGGVAAATAIVARILFVLVDVGGAAISAPAAGRRRGGVTVGPRPVPEGAEPD